MYAADKSRYCCYKHIACAITDVDGLKTIYDFEILFKNLLHFV